VKIGSLVLLFVWVFTLNLISRQNMQKEGVGYTPNAHLTGALSWHVGTGGGIRSPKACLAVARGLIG
jgi:hypothetical protein